jgi:hypothetical protein
VRTAEIGFALRFLLALLAEASFTAQTPRRRFFSALKAVEVCSALLKRVWGDKTWFWSGKVQFCEAGCRKPLAVALAFAQALL